MDTLLLIIGVLSAVIATAAFTGRYFVPAPAPKVDCIAEAIKSIEKVGSVKTACDKLNGYRPYMCPNCGY